MLTVLLEKMKALEAEKDGEVSVLASSWSFLENSADTPEVEWERSWEKGQEQAQALQYALPLHKRKLGTGKSGPEQEQHSLFKLPQKPENQEWTGNIPGLCTQLALAIACPSGAPS